MKKVDLTGKVMGKVVGFEKRHVKWWLGKFILVISVLCASFIFSAAVFQKEVLQRRILDLLSLFTEDKEIIGQFWQDTLGVVWEEIPHELLFLLGLIFLIFVIFIFVSRKRLKIIRKKMSQLEKYDRLH